VAVSKPYYLIFECSGAFIGVPAPAQVTAGSELYYFRFLNPAFLLIILIMAILIYFFEY
jgi:hypothetical protein